MLWTVRHLWNSGDCFLFNFYLHWPSLVLQNGNSTASFLHSKEGMMHNYPLAMIVYGVGILPLIKNLKMEIPYVTHPWYADNAESLDTFSRLKTCFYSLTRQGPGRGYYTKPSKSVLIIRLENIEVAKLFRSRHGFKVCMGTRYLWVFIGDDKSKRDYLR